jgi:hypothetical protein
MSYGPVSAVPLRTGLDALASSGSPVDVIQNGFLDDGQSRFGVSHLAYLPTWAIYLADPLRHASAFPARRLPRGLSRHGAAARKTRTLMGFDSQNRQFRRTLRDGA